MSGGDAAFEARLASFRLSFVARSLGDATDLEVVAARLAATTGGVSADDREQVRSIAHRLAGASGMFGFSVLTGPAVAAEDAARSGAAAGELASAAHNLAGDIRRTLGEAADMPARDDTSGGGRGATSLAARST